MVEWENPMMNFNVPAPEAAEGAILTFASADMRKLAEKYGPDYIAAVLTGLQRNDPEILAAVVAIALKGGDATRLLEVVPMDALGSRVADALMLRVYGRTAAELAAPPVIAES
jgi:hypothetical protein